MGREKCERGGKVIVSHSAQPFILLTHLNSPRAQVPPDLGSPPSGDSGPLSWRLTGDAFSMRCGAVGRVI